MVGFKNWMSDAINHSSNGFIISTFIYLTYLTYKTYRTYSYILSVNFQNASLPPACAMHSEPSAIN